MSLPRILKSSQAGAPTLTNSAGSLIALLDAVLVNGFNTVSVASITRSGTTVTVTLSAAASFVTDEVVRITNADQAEYNGDHRITAVSSTVFTFEIATTPTTPATGTISVCYAPLGWGKPFSGTNKAVYRSSSYSSPRPYFRFDNTNPDNTFTARLEGYSAMSDIDTGVRAFCGPSTWQAVPTSSSGSGHPWVVVGDDRTCYFAVDWYGDGWYIPVAFGDFDSYRAGDAYNSFIAGPGLPASSDDMRNYRHNSWVACSNFSNRVPAENLFLMRSASGTWPFANGCLVSGFGAYGESLGGGSMIGNFGYPYLPTGGMMIVPLHIYEMPTNGIRGKPRGLLPALHAIAALGPHGTVIDAPTGVGLDGRKLFLHCHISYNQGGAHLYDMTGPW